MKRGRRLYYIYNYNIKIMESLTKLAIPIYQRLRKQHPNLSERIEATTQHILNEVNQWGIKELIQDGNYYFKPAEFEGTENSKPFQVRLVLEDNGFYNLKFGNLNASSASKMFQWDKNDPYKLNKALFLYNVKNKKVLPLLQNNTIEGIQFEPYNEDGLGSDRMSYFNNMFDKLGNDFTWYKEDNTYYINKK